MRLLLSDIDDLAVTPADLRDVEFAGAPGAVSLSVDDGEAVTVTPRRSASLDRPTGSTSPDEWFDLSGELEPPCDATVSWPGGMAFLHVVALHYCSLDEVLDWGDEKRQSPRRLGRTEADAFRARAEAEAVADDICHRTFRSTRKVEVMVDSDGQGWQLGWPASRLVTPGWALAGDGVIRSTDRSRAGVPVDVEYVSGSDRGVPVDVRRAVARLAASYLTVSKVPDRAVYESTEAGMTRYTLAGVDSTGIPDVDAVLMRHARSRAALL